MNLNLLILAAAVIYPAEAAMRPEWNLVNSITMSENILEEGVGQGLSLSETADLELSPVAKSLLREPRRSITFDELNNLLPTDKAPLIAAFERSSLHDREVLAWAIAHLGDDAALETLKRPVELQDFDRRFTSSDLRFFGATLGAIGYLAQRSDLAYEYLLQNSTRKAWAHAENWDREPGMPPLDQRMAATVLKALSISGRAGVNEKISAFIASEEGRIAPVSGAVIDSLCCDWYIAKYGKEEVVKILLRGDMVRAIMKFYQTEQGKEWESWYRKVNGID